MNYTYPSILFYSTSFFENKNAIRPSKLTSQWVVTSSRRALTDYHGVAIYISLT